MAAKPLMALPFTRFSKSFTFLCPFNHKNFPVLAQACCILGWQPCEAGAFPPLDLCVWLFPSYLSTKAIFPEMLSGLPVTAHRPHPDGGPSNKCSFIPLPLLITAGKWALLLFTWSLISTLRSHCQELRLLPHLPYSKSLVFGVVLITHWKTTVSLFYTLINLMLLTQCLDVC